MNVLADTLFGLRAEKNPCPTALETSAQLCVCACVYVYLVCIFDIKAEKCYSASRPVVVERK